MRNHVFSWLFVAGSVLWVGCSGYRFVPPVTVAASAPVTPPVAPAPPGEAARSQVGVSPLPPCEVRMEIYNADRTVESGSICIKRSDQSFRFPFPIFLEGKEGRIGTQFNGMCLTAEKKELEPQPQAPKAGAPQDAGTAEDDSLTLRTCDWTRLFRDAYPLTFKIYTEGRKLPLGQFARIIRVFRNGRLVFSWKNENTLAEVVIPGSSLTARLLPFGAPIDLRIIPTTSPEDPRVVTKIDESIDPLLARINTAKTVLLAPIKEAVTEDLACLQWLVAGAQATAQGILGRPAKPQGPNPNPDRCEAPKGNAAALHERLRQSVVDAGSAVDRTLDEEIARLGKAYGDKIREAAAEAKQKLSKRAADAMLPNGHSVSSTIGQIDDLATAGAEIFDELNRSIRSTVADAKRFARDRDAQARQLAAVTEALELQGSAFDPYTKNPELVEGETALDMRYGDKFQWFTLAPWHGVPVRITGNAGADINLATAIPILDLIGFRYQWGTGRSTSFRTGLGFMYFQDEDALTTTAGTTASTSSSNVAAELNVGWAGMVFGAGYVLNDRSYDGFRDVDRIRLIIGADLLKVFGNRNAEVPVF